MADGDIGYGSIFEIGNGANPEVFTAIAEVFDLTPPSDTMDMVDVTHFGSPNRTREFVSGLVDPGECSFEMNFVPGSASDMAIQAWKVSGEGKTCRITYPNATTWTFTGYLTGYEPAVPLEDKMTATVTIKVTGSYVTDPAS